MATIRKLPSGKWNVQIRANGKLFASKTLASRNQADVWAERQNNSLERSHPLLVDSGHNYCHLVLAGKPSQRLAANRVDRICRHARLKKSMNRITLQDVNAFKQDRLSDVKPTTCRDELLMIRRIFRWYLRELIASTGETFPNPCDQLSIPRACKVRDRVISKEELLLLMSAMTPRMAVIVEFAFEAAMRRSEILRLTPENLRLEDRYLCVVDGKEGSRDVPLTTRAVRLLEGVLEACGGRGSQLFPVAAYSVTQSVRTARECQSQSNMGPDRGVKRGH